MSLVQLGQSNLSVSPVILGAWAIGGWMWGGSNEKDALEAIGVALDHGITTIDTAAIYGFGYSEELVGRAIKGRRDKVIIATKCGMRWDSDTGSDPWVQKDNNGKSVTIRKNSHPESILYECEQSLKRLNIDTIDLYQIHWPDSTCPIEDSWNAMVKLLNQGKVRAIGVSNYSAEQLDVCQKIHPVASLQPPYSLIRRDIEKDIVPFCQKNHIGIIAYSPLERGLLTGTVTPDRKFPPGDHRNQLESFSQEHRKKVLEALVPVKAIALAHRATVSQVIINATYSMPGITAAIVGARNAAQAIENAHAMKLQLTDEERRTIVHALKSVRLD